MSHDFSHAIIPTNLCDDTHVGHGDHWAIFGVDTQTLQEHLKSSVEKAGVPQGLGACKTQSEYLLIGTDEPCHIKQIFALEQGKPSSIINIFPALNSPYGVECRIKEVIVHQQTQDTILHLQSQDGTAIYAFDQLYALNACYYRLDTVYYVSFAAWSYNLSKSTQDEVILVDDPKAIRYHRAFNDIVAENGGQIPADIDEKISVWQPKINETLAPVEINLGHSCIYLFGETQGQQDEAWCQGQVLGKSLSSFLGKPIILFDVVILREPDASPLVVRIASLANEQTNAIQVRDYIQANIWLQAAIYGDKQSF